jgi:hypothetical protein
MSIQDFGEGDTVDFRDPPSGEWKRGMVTKPWTEIFPFVIVEPVDGGADVRINDDDDIKTASGEAAVEIASGRLMHRIPNTRFAIIDLGE